MAHKKEGEKRRGYKRALKDHLGGRGGGRG